MIEIVDTHCHLDFEENDNNIKEVIHRANKNNVEYLVSISVNLNNFDKINSIAEKYENIWCTTGIHPNYVFDEKRSIERVYQEIEKNISHKKVIGIGETGLDYFRSNKNSKKQMDFFELHLSLSGKQRLPTIVHTRNADKDTINMIKFSVKKYNSIGLIHCFCSSKELAKVALDNGFYISISGIVTYKGSNELREIIKYIPENRLLIETDSPYLSPVPLRGKRNEPANLIYTLNKISEIKEKSPEQIAKSTTDNFFQLFKRTRL